MYRFELEVDGVDQPYQGIDPQPVRVQRRRGEQLSPAHVEQVAHGDVRPLLGQHRLHTRFQSAAPAHQLGPMPHHLPQLAHCRAVRAILARSWT
jgi:hypothetical protein